MNLLFFDTETYCETPITYGTHRYAEDAEIIMWQWAIDDGPVQISETLTPELRELLEFIARQPADYTDAQLDALFSRPRTRIVTHNSAFDRTVLRHAAKLDIPVENWHDTMVQAMAHGLPGGLGILCEIFKISVDKAKDKAGKDLIQLFCKPRPQNSKLRRATKATHPEKWAQFLGYGGLDVEAMREIYRKLPKWNYNPDGTPGSAGKREFDMWCLDQRINDRGVCVDLDLAHAAIRAANREQERLATEARERTDGAVEAATQRDKLLKHILEAYGVGLPDLQISTLERRIADEDLPLELRQLLEIRLQACKTSTSKYKRVVNGVSKDGRLRGLLQFCGASRTGRFAGRLFQPQNLPRPTMDADDIEDGIAAIKADCEDLLYDNVMDLTSNALRGVLVAPKGKKMVVADLSNIEGRGLAEIAGEDWKLQAFREYDTYQRDENGELIPDGKGDYHRCGPDLYKLAYAKSFGIDPDDVAKDQRQIGKVQELAFGYQGGVGAWLTFALAYSIDLEDMAAKAFRSVPEDTLLEAQGFMDWQASLGRGTMGLSDRAFIVCESFKRLWRAAHPASSSLWGDLETQVICAINNPGRTFTCRSLKVRRDGAWLRIVLPSGRSLCYVSPKIEDGKINYMGINQYSRKWSRLSTYGGKLVENVTQGFARDVMTWNMPTIEEAGYEIVLSVHDELLTETPDEPEYNADQLAALMAANPPWAPDMPLAAAGFDTYRYRKD